MPAIVKIGDQDTESNTVDNVQNNTNVYADNQLVARTTDKLTDDTTILGTSPDVFVHGLGVARIGDSDTDDATLTSNQLEIGVNSKTGAGAIVDDNPPLTPPTTPSDMNYTSAYIAVNPYTTKVEEALYDKDDQQSIAALPPGTFALDKKHSAADLTPASANTTPTHTCPDVDALSSEFNWISQPPSSAWLAANPSYSTYLQYITATGNYFNPFQDWSSQFQLSTNYSVYDLTMGTAISRYTFTDTVNQNGSASLSQQQTLDNLCYHANIVLEPMRAAYTSDQMTITSAFRSLSGASQHNEGQATDIQFLNFHNQSNTAQLYYARAQLIRDTFNFDQMILEWYGKNPWIHISSNFSGQRHSILTQTGPNSYSPGLVLLN